MLIIIRSFREVIRIGNDVELTYLSAVDGAARLGVSAPSEVTITRKELYKRDPNRFTKRQGDSPVDQRPSSEKPMLFLVREPGEAFMINDDIEVLLLGIDAETQAASFGITAPLSVNISRGELQQTANKPEPRAQFNRQNQNQPKRAKRIVRQLGEGLNLTDNISLRINKITDAEIDLAITAPRSIKIHRGETSRISMSAKDQDRVGTLILGRRTGQSAIIGGNISLTVVQIENDQVILDMVAPTDVMLNVSRQIDMESNKQETTEAEKSSSKTSA